MFRPTFEKSRTVVSGICVFESVRLFLSIIIIIIITVCAGHYKVECIWTVHVICKIWKLTFEEKLSVFQDKSFSAWRYFVTKWEVLLEAGGRYLEILLWIKGTAVAQWLRCCATNRKVVGSIPDGVIGIFHWHNTSDRTMALGSTQPLTEMSTRRISWG